MAEVLGYRPAEPAEAPFILDSWLYSFRSADAAGLIAMEDWPSVMRPQLAKVLARSGVLVTVAYKPGEMDHRADLYGWIAVERDFLVVRRRPHERPSLVKSDEPLVHYVFVKQPYRQLGIARGLFNAAGVSPASPFLYTCKTGAAVRLAPKIPLARWEPLIARHPKD